MAKSKDERTSHTKSTATQDYRGPERRAPSADGDEPKLSKRIRFDTKGNPVWEVRVETPGRRADDDTVDLLKCLEPDELTLADDDEKTGTE
jgi:hypothetical protein